MKNEIQELFEDFVYECEFVKKLSPVTIRGFRQSFELLMKLMPDTTLENLSAGTFNSFFEQLETRRRMVGKNVKRGVKKSTVRTYGSKLKSFIKWLRKRGYIKNDPLEDVQLPSVRYDDRRYLKKEDVEKIMSAVSWNIKWASDFVRKRNIAMFNVFLFCGLRKGEMLGLKMDDIDLDRKLLTVRGETSKSRMDRVIPLNPLVIFALKDYLSVRRRNNKESLPFVWLSNNGEDRFTEHGLKHLVKKVVLESHVKFHVHRFRHTFAINLIYNGSDLSKVQQLLGHTDIEMTSKYLRVFPMKGIECDIDKLTIDNLA